MDLDVEINSYELKQLVEGLEEGELRTGKGNLVLWLRNQYSTRLLEPELELTDDFITYYTPRKPPESEKIIRWSKVFGIMETLGLLSVDPPRMLCLWQPPSGMVMVVGVEA